MCNGNDFIQRKHGLGLEQEEYRGLRRSELIVGCQNLINETNVGSIIRTADAFLVGKVYLTNKSWARAAATGAHGLQPLEYVRSMERIIEGYKAEGYRIVALEQTTNSIPLNRYAFEPRTFLVVGNEGAGITPSILGLADDALEIPHLGWTESLNVAVSASIALWEYTKQVSL